MQQLEKDVATYNNYFSFDTTSGIRISAKDKEGNIKYDSATGAKDYRWLESEDLKEYVEMDEYYEVIDLDYYERLVDEAVEDISKYGNLALIMKDFSMKKEQNFR